MKFWALFLHELSYSVCVCVCVCVYIHTYILIYMRMTVNHEIWNSLYYLYQTLGINYPSWNLDVSIFHIWRSEWSFPLRNQEISAFYTNQWFFSLWNIWVSCLHLCPYALHVCVCVCVYRCVLCLCVFLCVCVCVLWSKVGAQCETPGIPGDIMWARHLFVHLPWVCPC